MTTCTTKPRIDVESIAKYEPAGRDLIGRYRKDIISIANKEVDWFFNRKFKDFTHKTDKGRYIFKPADSPECKVLAVAHLDTVVCPKKKGFSWNHGRDDHNLDIVKMTTVDDRLGVAIIMFMLPELGIEVDWLFTEGEETSNSTAKDWKHPDGKQYNWLVEFDRAGSSLSGQNDCVTYMFNGTEWHAALKASGFNTIGQGTFTDICYLQELGAKAFNVAIGYHDNHDPGAWFRLGELARAMELFKAFYDTNKDVAFEHKPVYTPVRYTSYSTSDTWDTGQYGSIGYVGSAYQKGDVVQTSLAGRWDKKPVIGEIWHNYRSGMWLIVNEGGLVVDTVSYTSHIAHQMECPNCGRDVVQAAGRPKWGRHRNSAFCGECWSYCKDYPETVLDALIQQWFIEVDGLAGVIYSLDIEEAMVGDGDDMFAVSREAMARMTRYSFKAEANGVSLVVHPLFLTEGNVRFDYRLVDRQGDMVHITRDQTDDGMVWVVPANIMQINKEIENVTS